MALQQRLVAAGCEVTPVVDHHILRSIYFHDVNGIALEASWWTTDGRGLSSGLRIRKCSPTQIPYPL
ncbi:MAG: hypothetical protein CM1200mP26_09530 [Acidimicrobiales bacterium]|nr:MAG: hypothetical protein CM1200mP26_09530 [Acidimicrobiales bacterium]